MWWTGVRLLLKRKLCLRGSSLTVSASLKWKCMLQITLHIVYDVNKNVEVNWVIWMVNNMRIYYQVIITICSLRILSVRIWHASNSNHLTNYNFQRAIYEPLVQQLLVIYCFIQMIVQCWRIWNITVNYLKEMMICFCRGL